MQDTSPLGALEQAVLLAKANREEAEDTLQTLPRWRFRRRRHVARRVLRRRSREESLVAGLTEGSSEAPERLIG